MNTSLRRFSGSENITFSLHAAIRMKQREVSDRDVRTILRFGTVEPAEENRWLVILIPNAFASLDDTGAMTRLSDYAVVITDDNTVVTVYRADERCPYYRPCLTID